MKILVDADACPVIKIIEKIAKSKTIDVTLVCDRNHVMSTNYSKVVTVEPGQDSADFVLLSLAERGDIVVTQDYGVAALVLGKGVYCLNQNGMRYTSDNIDQLLFERHMNKKSRRASSKNHIKGPSARTANDNVRFENALILLINELNNTKK